MAETAVDQLKQSGQTQDADGVDAISVLYTTQLEANSQQQYVSMNKGGELQTTSPRRFPLRPYSLASCSTLNRKPFDVSLRSHPVKFF